MLNNLKIKSYEEFLTLRELDKAIHEASKEYGFEVREVGRSEQDHPIYMLKMGKGKRKIFLWGFPHPNEPIGSLLVDSLVEHFGKNKAELEKTNATWYCMYTADPDGTKLNESWFKGKLTLERYFRGFYRQGASRMVDWTFPIKYKDFEWNTSLKETQCLKKIIDEIKPDVMYPLHNSGFGGAYFFATRKFSPRYYKAIREATKKEGIPLHKGEPEEEFMVEIEKPFYYDFGFKEYYDYAKKLEKDPKKILRHGDNSTGYLSKIKPESVTIKTEVPYFYSPDIADTSDSIQTRREVWLSFIHNSREHAEKVQPIVEQALLKIDKKSPWHHKMQDYQRAWEQRSDAMKNHVMKDPSFDRKATKAEVFDGLLGAYFYGGGTVFGQVRRAAIEAKLDKKIIEQLETEVQRCSEIIARSTKWETIPLQNLVQLQATVLNETLKELDS